MTNSTLFHLAAYRQNNGKYNLKKDKVAARQNKKLRKSIVNSSKHHLSPVDVPAYLPQLEMLSLIPISVASRSSKHSSSSNNFAWLLVVLILNSQIVAAIETVKEANSDMVKPPLPSGENALNIYDQCNGEEVVHRPPYIQFDSVLLQAKSYIETSWRERSRGDNVEAAKQMKQAWQKYKAAFIIIDINIKQYVEQTPTREDLKRFAKCAIESEKVLDFFIENKKYIKNVDESDSSIFLYIKHLADQHAPTISDAQAYLRIAEKLLFCYELDEDDRNSAENQLEVIRKKIEQQVNQFVNEALLNKDEQQLLYALETLNADPNAFNAAGFAPLHVACIRGDLRLIKLLLNNRADSELMTRDGRTPLVLAVTEDNFEAVLLLLGTGAKMEPGTWDGMLLQHKAIADLLEKYTKIETLLNTLDSATAIIELDKLSDNLKQSLAFQRLRTQAYKNLQANPNAFNADGFAPLHVACKNGNLELVRFLLEFADPNQAMAEGSTPLILATAGSGEAYEAIVRLLIPKSNVNHADIMNRTAVFNPVTREEVGIARALIEGGIDVNWVGNGGITPLAAAADWGCPNTTLLLLDSGAVLQADMSKKTPWDYAKMNGRQAVLDILEPYIKIGNFLSGSDSDNALKELAKLPPNLQESLTFQRLRAEVLYKNSYQGQIISWVKSPLVILAVLGAVLMTFGREYRKYTQRKKLAALAAEKPRGKPHQLPKLKPISPKKPLVVTTDIKEKNLQRKKEILQKIIELETDLIKEKQTLKKLLTEVQLSLTTKFEDYSGQLDTPWMTACIEANRILHKSQSTLPLIKENYRKHITWMDEANLSLPIAIEEINKKIIGVNRLRVMAEMWLKRNNYGVVRETIFNNRLLDVAKDSLSEFKSQTGYDAKREADFKLVLISRDEASVELLKIKVDILSEINQLIAGFESEELDLIDLNDSFSFSDLELENIKKYLNNDTVAKDIKVNCQNHMNWIDKTQLLVQSEANNVTTRLAELYNLRDLASNWCNNSQSDQKNDSLQINFFEKHIVSFSRIKTPQFRSAAYGYSEQQEKDFVSILSNCLMKHNGAAQSSYRQLQSMMSSNNNNSLPKSSEPLTDANIEGNSKLSMRALRLFNIVNLNCRLLLSLPIIDWSKSFDDVSTRINILANLRYFIRASEILSHCHREARLETYIPFKVINGLRNTFKHIGGEFANATPSEYKDVQVLVESSRKLASYFSFMMGQLQLGKIPQTFEDFIHDQEIKDYLATQSNNENSEGEIFDLSLILARLEMSLNIIQVCEESMRAASTDYLMYYSAAIMGLALMGKGIKAMLENPMDVQMFLSYSADTLKAIKQLIQSYQRPILNNHYKKFEADMNAWREIRNNPSESYRSMPQPLLSFLARLKNFKKLQEDILAILSPRELLLLCKEILNAMSHSPFPEIREDGLLVKIIQEAVKKVTHFCADMNSIIASLATIRKLAKNIKYHYNNKSHLLMSLTHCSSEMQDQLLETLRREDWMLLCNEILEAEGKKKFIDIPRSKTLLSNIAERIQRQNFTSDNQNIANPATTIEANSNVVGNAGFPGTVDESEETTHYSPTHKS